jgi:L-serine dehydratase
MQLLGEALKKAFVYFDKDGAWAPNYREQGTTLGMDGGLLGIPMTDERIKNTESEAEKRGIEIHYRINSFENNHVNSFRIFAQGIHGRMLQLQAASLGGGAFEIQSINEHPVHLTGDSHELILLGEFRPEHVKEIKDILPEVMINEMEPVNNVINLKFTAAIPKLKIDQLKNKLPFAVVMTCAPVVPILAGNERPMPFSDVETLLSYAEAEDKSLADMGRMFEMYRGGISKQEVNSLMHEIVSIIENSIAVGLQGTAYEDRILPRQSHLIKEAVDNGTILNNDLINNIISNVSAIMESKSALEVVVANPTAGSCGAVGGVLKAVADSRGSNRNELLDAYFASALIGVYFAKGPGFSAEEHGCQVECGASAGMAAAGIVQLYGGTARQAVDAASMAIQNMIGLICDPIADRVEAPCLGKNVSAAMNALSSATMVRAGFNALIPLEEVIETVGKVSLQMPSCNKCTGKGGLAITKTACALKDKLSAKFK